jgi:hypothetical protein
MGMDYSKILRDFKRGYEEREREAEAGSMQKEAYRHILAEIDLEEKRGTPKERVVLVQTALEMLVNSIEPPEASPLAQEAYDMLTKRAKLEPFSLEAEGE